MKCLNCGAELQGAFCHVCGQKATAHHLSVHDVTHDAVHEFLHLDGKILQTMKLLLLRPGQLTKEFIEGRRVRYISPIRLYLTWSVIFFALTAITPAKDRIIKIGPGRDTAQSERAKSDREAEKLGQEILHTLPRVMFVLMPVFGLLTWVFYRKQQPHYVAHLYYSIHFHAFTFFLLSAGVLLALGGRVGKAIGMPLFLAAFPYHFIALKRVFDGPRVYWKAFAVGVLYWIVVAGAMVGMTLLLIRGL